MIRHMPRVLLIDDETRVASALEYALADPEFEIRSVRDASDLDALAKPEVPDVVLLDIALVGENGLDVCRRLRADARFVHVPVLLLSGQTDAATKHAGFDAGADDFVAKPFKPDDLVTRMRAHMRRRQNA